MKIVLVHQWSALATGLELAKALRELGHEVTWIGESDTWGHPGYAGDVDLPTLLHDCAHWDLAIATDDNWLPNVPRGWERLPFPTAFFSFDYQHSPSWFDPVLPLFDHIFLFNLDPVDRVRQKNQNAHWLPAAIDLSYFPIETVERTFDVGIVGGMNPHYPVRVKRIRDLAARYRTNDVNRMYARTEVATIYNRSKIVVNLMPDGVKTLSYRTFEGMACGALMICQETDSSLDELFVRGEHLVVFKTEAEMYDLIDYYLAHDTEREEIASRGQGSVRQHHTWAHRMKPVCEVISGSGLPAPARAMTHSEIKELYARAYYRRQKIDQLLGLYANERPPVFVWPMIAKILLRKANPRRPPR